MQLAFVTLAIYLVATALGIYQGDDIGNGRAIGRRHKSKVPGRDGNNDKHVNPRGHDEDYPIEVNSTAPGNHTGYNDPAFAEYWDSDYYKQSSDSPESADTLAGGHDWPELKGR